MGNATRPEPCEVPLPSRAIRRSIGRERVIERRCAAASCVIGDALEIARRTIRAPSESATDDRRSAHRPREADVTVDEAAQFRVVAERLVEDRGIEAHDVEIEVHRLVGRRKRSGASCSGSEPASVTSPLPNVAPAFESTSARRCRRTSPNSEAIEIPYATHARSRRSPRETSARDTCRRPSASTRTTR